MGKQSSARGPSDRNPATVERKSAVRAFYPPTINRVIRDDKRNPTGQGNMTMNGRKFIGASVLTIALMLGAAGTAWATHDVNDATVAICIAHIEDIQEDLGAQCQGVVLVAGGRKDNTAKTCTSLNDKLEGAIDKLDNPKGPKTVDAYTKLQNFIDSLNTKAAQGKILDGTVDVADLVADAEAAQVCITEIPG